MSNPTNPSSPQQAYKRFQESPMADVPCTLDDLVGQTFLITSAKLGQTRDAEKREFVTFSVKLRSGARAAFTTSSGPLFNQLRAIAGQSGPYLVKMVQDGRSKRLTKPDERTPAAAETADGADTEQADLTTISPNGRN